MIEGKPASLKGEDVFGIEYVYHDLKVGKLTEEAYIEKHKQEREEKEAGSGEAWLEAWKNDRATRYEPKFEELFNKYGEKYNLFVDNAKDDTPYKMIVHTYFIEPGYNVGVSSRPAFVSMYISLVETANPENVLARYDVMRSPGTAHYDAGLRISESYAKAAKSFSKVLGKAVK